MGNEKELMKYTDEDFVLSKIKELAKKKVISQSMALHYQTMLKDRNYFYDLVEKKLPVYSSKTPYRKTISESERLAALTPLPSNYGNDMQTLASPLHIAADIILMDMIFLQGLGIGTAQQAVKDLSMACIRTYHNIREEPPYWRASDAMLGDLLLIGHKTLCMDHFRVTDDVSRLMCNTQISDKVPSEMVMPTRPMTFIEVPKDSGLKLFNDLTGWHELASVTILKDFHPANSGATNFYPPSMIKEAGIDESTPFTRLCFYFCGRPHDGDPYLDDATMYINILIKDLDRPLIEPLSLCLADRTALQPNDVFRMIAEETNTELLHYADDDRERDTIKLVRWASSIMLFVNSNYARKELVPSATVQSGQTQGGKVNTKKLALRIQRESAAPAFTRLKFQSSDSDQNSVNDYLRDSSSETRRVSPHWRGPHWRSQHHGAENKLIKLVFIAPVFVGAKNMGEPLPGRRKIL